MNTSRVVPLVAVVAGVVAGVVALALIAWPLQGRAQAAASVASTPPTSEAAPGCVGDSAPTMPSAEGLSAFARPDVKAIAEQITCYCGCPHLQVSKCFCGTADRIRESVATQIDQGMTPEAIIAAYVVEHGTWVMAEPPKRGFNWIIWLGPVFLVVFGAAALFWAGRRMVTLPASAGSVRPALEPTSPGSASSSTTARLREQLERELERER